jgi:homoserine dehydrogenase
MENEAVSFRDALSRAQEMGYAEADPSHDLGGFDASCKLAILARVGLGAQLNPQDVYSRSIEGVEAVDFEYARKLGCTIRQVAIAELKATELYAAVQPTLVPLGSPLAVRRFLLAAVREAGLPRSRSFRTWYQYLVDRLSQVRTIHQS